MKFAGRAVLFELKDMIGSGGAQTTIEIGDTSDTRRKVLVRAVPEPFSDGLLARIRSAWEVVRGRAYPTLWPKAGELEAMLSPVLKKHVNQQSQETDKP